MADIRVTSTLTTFGGPNEDPLSDGGRWLAAGILAGGAMARKGNAAVNSIIGGATLGHSYWTPSTYNDSDLVECWGTPVGGGGGAGGEGWRLGLFQQPGSSTVDGYTGLFFSTGAPLILIRKYTNGSFVNLAAAASSAGGADIHTRFLFRRTASSTLEWWASIDDGVTWNLDCSTTDGSYTGDFYLGIGAEDQGGGQICEWRAFGGGNPRHRQQMYRILRGTNPTFGR